VIFAGVKIGDDSIIGPNAVVMSDVPAGARVFVDVPRVIQFGQTSPTTGKGSVGVSGK
jgi:serine acetyltransferase